MSGAGLLVGSLQRVGFEPQVLIALHMWIIAPSLLILLSKAGRYWHQIAVQQ